MEDKHTEYKILERYADNGVFSHFDIIENEDGLKVAECSEIVKAKAIVKAVNNHDKLVGALDQIRHKLSFQVNDIYKDHDFAIELLLQMTRQAQKALNEVGE